jgi:hypothetical protein
MAKRGQLRWRPKRMRIRQSAYSGNGADRARTRTSRQEVGALALSSSSERLEYIAAMVQQLKIIAAQANYRKLAGLLELAYHEALRRRRAGQ